MNKQFIDKKDSNFTPQEAKDIWNYAYDKYLKNTNSNRTFDDMLNDISNDLGLTTQQVRYAISQPKGAKKLVDKIERIQNKRVKTIKKANNWIKTANYPKIIRFFKLTPVWTWILKWDKKDN